MLIAKFLLDRNLIYFFFCPTKYKIQIRSKTFLRLLGFFFHGADQFVAIRCSLQITFPLDFWQI